MALTTVPLPYGLRDVKIRVLTGETPAATGIDFPNSRTLGFTETEESEELRGDDGVAAVHGRGSSIDWTLEGGGYSFEAVAAMFGGLVAESGVTPNQKKTYTKKDTDVRPYFEIEGQAISDSGGDFHVLIPRAKCTGELSGTLADATFWLTGAAGQGLPRASDRRLYQIIQNETAVPLV